MCMYVCMSFLCLLSSSSNKDVIELHPEGNQAFGSSLKAGVAEGKAVELGRFVADMCKGNPMVLEPLCVTAKIG